MGVKGLWSLLEPAARPVRVETLAGKRLAVDASIWLYQFLKAMRDDEGNVLRSAHILGFFRRICKLLFHNIKPIFVFDGGVPELKRLTVVERRKRKERSTKNYQRTAEKLLEAQLKLHALNNSSSKRKKGTELSIVKSQGEDVIDEVPDDVLYLDELENPQLKRYKQQDDEYVLPTIPKAMSGPIDHRFVTEEELHQFIDQHKDERDLAAVDIDSTMFQQLPLEIQHEIIVDLKNKSRHYTRSKREELVYHAKSALTFSQLQVQNLMTRNKFTQRLLDFNKHGAKGSATPQRVVSERNRQFVLIRNEEQNGGWAMGFAPTEKQESQEEISSSLSTNDPLKTTVEYVSDDEEFESVPLAPLDHGNHNMNNFNLSAPNGKTKSLIDIDGYDMQEERNDKKEFLSSLKVESMQDSDVFLQYWLFKVPEEFLTIQPKSEALLRTVIWNYNFNEVMEARQRAEQKKGKMSISENTICIDFWIEFLEAVILWKQQRIFNGENPVLSEYEEEEAEKEDEEEEIEQEEEEKKRKRGKEKDNLISMEERDEMGISEELFESSDDGMNWGDVVVSSPEEVNFVVAENSNGKKINDHVKSLESQELPIYFEDSDDSDFLDASKKSQVKMNKDKNVGIVLEGNDSSDKLPVIMESTMGDNNIQTSETHEFIVAPLKAKSSQQKPKPISLFQKEDNDGTVTSEMSAITSITTTCIDKSESFVAKNESHSLNISNKPVMMHVKNGKDTMVILSDDDTITSPMLKIDEAIEHVTSVASNDTGLHNMDKSESLQLELKSTQTEDKTNSRIVTVSDHDEAAEEEDGIHEAEEEEEEEDDEDIHENDEGTGIDVSTHLNDETFEFAKFVSSIAQRPVDDIRKELQTDMTNLKAQQRREQKDAADVTDSMVIEIQELLKIFGLPYIIAPLEAEAQCSQLLMNGHVDGIVTDDSDIFLFGGTEVYRNMFNQSKYVEKYTAENVELEVGLTRKRMIQLAYLLGSDYTPGITGVGAVTAMEILSEWPGEDGLYQFKEWWSTAYTGGVKDLKESKKLKKLRRLCKKIELSSTFPDQRVAETYLNPVVETSDERFVWGIPDPERTRKYLEEKLGWSYSKTDEVLNPLLKAMRSRLTEGAQSTLEKFFEGVTQYPHGHKSSRVREAVQKFKNVQGSPSSEPVISSSTGKKTSSTHAKKSVKRRENGKSISGRGGRGGKKRGEKKSNVGRRGQDTAKGIKAKKNSTLVQDDEFSTNSEDE